MECTTQRDIHARFKAIIAAITPTYPGWTGKKWGYVDEMPAEVSGPEIRRFTLDCTIAEPTPEGLFSMGEEYEFQLDINVAYGALPKNVAPWLISQDAVDLRTVLEAQLSPTLTGLLSVRRVAFASGSEESGHWFGAHVFMIHYMHDTSATLIPEL